MTVVNWVFLQSRYVSEVRSVMEKFEIQNPEIELLKSSPSSLGTINYYMALFDALNVSEFESKIEVLSENIDDEENHYPFFLLHSTSTRGEPIIPLKKARANESQFCVNRTNTDSALKYHCLAYKNKGDRVSLKSGFHSWQVSDSSDERMPIGWDTMDQMDGEVYFLVNMLSERFWSQYESALKSWVQLIKT